MFPCLLDCVILHQYSRFTLLSDSFDDATPSVSISLPIIICQSKGTLAVILIGPL